MELTGDRARSGFDAAARALAVALAVVLAVALVPALRCPPVLDFDDQHSSGAPSMRTATTVRVEIAAMPIIDAHSACQMPSAASATAAIPGPGRGGGVIAAVGVAFLAVAAGAGWVSASRGPPTRRRARFLYGGRDRLRHLCVMRC